MAASALCVHAAAGMQVHAPRGGPVLSRVLRLYQLAAACAWSPAALHAYPIDWCSRAWAGARPRNGPLPRRSSQRLQGGNAFLPASAGSTLHDQHSPRAWAGAGSLCCGSGGLRDLPRRQARRGHQRLHLQTTGVDCRQRVGKDTKGKHHELPLPPLRCMPGLGGQHACCGFQRRQH